MDHLEHHSPLPEQPGESNALLGEAAKRRGRTPAGRYVRVGVIGMALGVLLGIGAAGLLRPGSPQGGKAVPPAVTGESAPPAQTLPPAEATPAAARAAGFLDPAQYGDAVLPETADAGQKYIDSTLFVGDSNTLRYYTEGTVPLAGNIGVTGMGATLLRSFPCVDFAGSSSLATIPQAIRLIQPQRVVFGFGTNDLAASNKAENFAAYYGKAIEACYENYPYFTVIVSSVPPLGQGATSLRQTQADAFNEALAALCKEKGWHFLDSASAMKDEKTGWAKEGYTIPDGVHLSEKGVEAFLRYFRTHAIQEEDIRPKPLKAIPAHARVDETLLSPEPSEEPHSQTAAEGVTVRFSVQGDGGQIEGEAAQTLKPGETSSEVWVRCSEGWYLDHWEFSNGATSRDVTISVRIPEDYTGSAFSAVAILAPL